MVWRIIALIILLFSVLFLPFWMSVILAILEMIYFSFLIEATILFLFSDLLYGLPETGPFGTVLDSFFMSLLGLIILELLKKKLKFRYKIDDFSKI